MTCTRDGDQVRIDVRDDGPGLPQAQLDRLFRPFDRLGLDEVRDVRTGGSGLGLVVARGLAEAMAGRPEITSTVGEGTTARLSLPATRHGDG